MLRVLLRRSSPVLKALILELPRPTVFHVLLTSSVQLVPSSLTFSLSAVLLAPLVLPSLLILSPVARTKYV